MLKNIGYKYRVLIAITLLMIVVVLSFGIVFFKGQLDRNTQLRNSELAKDTENIMASIENSLMTVHKYYLATESNDEVRFLVENDVDYSQVSAITKGTETLAGKNIVSDYVSAYTLVNFKTGTVLGSRGRYSTTEVVNLDVLTQLYDTYRETYTKNLWVYVDGEAPDKNSRQYRMTVPVSGLDLVLFAPFSEVIPYSLIIVNINLNQITNDLNNQLHENEDALLLSSDGEIIFSTDSSINDALLFAEQGGYDHVKSLDGRKLYVSSRKSDIGGLRLIVSYDADASIAFEWTYLMMFVVIILLLLLVAAFVFRSIYKPIKTAALEVSRNNDQNLKPGEDELKYLTNSIKKLDSKNTELINQTSVLFATRLYRDELTEKEIDQYLYRLSLMDKVPAKFRVLTYVLKSLGEETTISSEEDKRICNEIIDEFRGLFVNEEVLPPVYYAKGVVAFLPGEDNETEREKVYRIYNTMTQFVYEKYHMNIGVGISSTYEDIHLVNKAYMESVQALHFGKIDNGSYLSHYRQDAGMGELKYDEESAKVLQKSLRKGDKEKAYEIIDEFFKSLIEKDLKRESAIPVLMQLVNDIIFEAQGSGAGTGVFRETPGQIYSAIIDYRDLNRVRKYIKFNMIDPLIHYQNEVIDSQSGNIMMAIEQLVEEKEGNITLNECSEILSYHTSYIWRILKEEKGMTFTEYIEKYKLDMAKKLLKETDMTVGAIAERLNYTNAQNFIRFFNKMEGTTPGKYRQAIKNDQ